MNPRPRDITGELVRPISDYTLRRKKSTDGTGGKFIHYLGGVTSPNLTTKENARVFPGGHLISVQNDYHWTLLFEAVKVPYDPSL